MYGIFLILLFYLLGCFVAALIGNFVPGSVIGMILLFCALSLKWVRPGHVKKVSMFLLDNMMLFLFGRRRTDHVLHVAEPLHAGHHRGFVGQHGAGDRGGRAGGAETGVEKTV